MEGPKTRPHPTSSSFTSLTLLILSAGRRLAPCDGRRKQEKKQNLNNSSKPLSNAQPTGAGTAIVPVLLTLTLCSSCRLGSISRAHLERRLRHTGGQSFEFLCARAELRLQGSRRHVAASQLQEASQWVRQRGFGRVGCMEHMGRSVD